MFGGHHEIIEAKKVDEALSVATFAVG